MGAPEDGCMVLNKQLPPSFVCGGHFVPVSGIGRNASTYATVAGRVIGKGNTRVSTLLMTSESPSPFRLQTTVGFGFGARVLMVGTSDSSRGFDPWT